MPTEKSTQEHVIDLRRYLLLFRRWMWLLVASVVLGAASSFAVTQWTHVPVYRASTTLLVNEAPGARRSGYYAPMVSSGRLVTTYARLMVTRPVLEAVIAQMGLEMEVELLRAMVRVQPVLDAQLINILVTDPDSARVARIANGIVAAFIRQNEVHQTSRYAAPKGALAVQLERLKEQIDEQEAKLSALSDSSRNGQRAQLENSVAEYRRTYAGILQTYEQVRVTEAQSISNVIQIEPAVPPRIPIPLKTERNTVLGALGGLLVGLVGIFLREALDDTLSDPDMVAYDLGLPILGVVAHYDVSDSNIVTTNPRSPIAEAFRTLRTQINFLDVDHPPRSLLVTSPELGEGKSTIAVNLAAALAQSGRSVALVDADMRRPTLHKKLSIPNGDGLSSLFTEPQDHINGALKEAGFPNCLVLPSGSLPPNPSELMGSQKMLDILDRVKERTDMLVIDTPPTMAVSDALVLAPRVDGVLLVVKPSTTTQKALKQTVEHMQRVGAKVLGIVLNDLSTNGKGYDYYYYQGYYYRDYYSSDTPKPRKRFWKRKRKNVGTLEG